METPNTESVEDLEKLLLEDDAPATNPRPVKLSKRPPGQIVTAVMDATGVEMTAEERAQLDKIADDEAMKAFLEAGLGPADFVGQLKARSLFGSYMMEKMNHKAIGIATRAYNISSAQKCIEFAVNMASKAVTDEDKISAGKLWIMGCRELSVMLKRFEDMAQEFAPDDKPPKGRNNAPDIFVENANILVQQPT